MLVHTYNYLCKQSIVYEYIMYDDGCISAVDQNHTDTDEEKELELLYDPGMNYYYDPQTGKYYELV